MTTNRSRRLGFAIAALAYLAACLTTIGTAGHPLRPLYEGIGPAPPYRWVKPPAPFKATNVAPIAGTQTIPLTKTGSPQTGAATIDGQLVLALPAGAFPANDDRPAVTLTITPLDPTTLGALPAGLYPDGNAYHLSAQYQPNPTAITSAAHPIDAVVETPAPATTVLQSPDGKAWQPVATHHIPGRAAVATTFTQVGYLLAAASVPVVIKPSSGGSKILLVVILGLVAIVPLTAAVIWRNGSRRRRR
jgi:hypothetical protein